MSPHVPCVFACEEQAGDGWRRWIELTFLAGEAVYTFTAEASALTFDADVDAAIQSPLFVPCTTKDAATDDMVESAVNACRAVALRLHVFGVDRHTVASMWPWPWGWPTFADVVAGRADLAEQHTPQELALALVAQLKGGDVSVEHVRLARAVLEHAEHAVHDSAK